MRNPKTKSKSTYYIVVNIIFFLLTLYNLYVLANTTSSRLMDGSGSVDIHRQYQILDQPNPEIFLNERKYLYSYFLNSTISIFKDDPVKIVFVMKTAGVVVYSLFAMLLIIALLINSPINASYPGIIAYFVIFGSVGMYKYPISGADDNLYYFPTLFLYLYLLATTTQYKAGIRTTIIGLLLLTNIYFSILNFLHLISIFIFSTTQLIRKKYDQIGFCVNIIVVVLIGSIASFFQKETIFRTIEQGAAEYFQAGAGDNLSMARILSKAFPLIYQGMSELFLCSYFPLLFALLLLLLLTLLFSNKRYSFLITVHTTAIVVYSFFFQPDVAERWDFLWIQMAVLIVLAYEMKQPYVYNLCIVLCLVISFTSITTLSEHQEIDHRFDIVRELSGLSAKKLLATESVFLPLPNDQNNKIHFVDINLYVPRSKRNRYYRKKDNGSCFVYNDEFKLEMTFVGTNNCPPQKLITKNTLVY